MAHMTTFVLIEVTEDYGDAPDEHNPRRWTVDEVAAKRFKRANSGANIVLVLEPEGKLRPMTNSEARK